MGVRQGLIGVQVLLTALCGWGLFGILRAFAADTGPPELAPLPELTEVAAAEPGPEHYRVILERNLFHSAVLPDSAPIPAVEKVAESTRPLRLRGTMVASLAELSLATIEHLNKDEMLHVHPGDTIDGLRVERITRGTVVLSARNGLERLTFDPDDKGKPSATATRKRGTRTARAGARSDARAQRTQGSVNRPPPTRARRRPSTTPLEEEPRRVEVPAAPGELPEELEEGIRELASQARFLPDFAEQGGLRGIVVRDVQPGTRLAGLGIQNGDVIVAVEGRPIEQNDNVFEALQGIDLNGGVSVDIERNGAPQTLQVPAGVL